MTEKIITAIVFGGLAGFILNYLVSLAIGLELTNPATTTILGIIAGLIIVLIMEVNDWRYQDK